MDFNLIQDQALIKEASLKGFNFKLPIAEITFAILPAASVLIFYSFSLGYLLEVAYLKKVVLRDLAKIRYYKQKIKTKGRVWDR